ncbi:MAG TPA: helix-turn-helix transcriptional regulator [Solirubrobacteraceae bacterium]|jgi:AraC-like DNA-binding protein|nr:helix-turn-helix transcriptional regulator [Solirubrobacteraceae bacterium]
MTYREHPPPPALAPWVQCAWQRSGDGGSPIRVVPDGCIDVVWIEGSGTQVVGPNTIAFLVPLAAGARVAGVRLHPGAAPALLDVDAAALRDGRLAIDDAWGDDGRRLAEALDEHDDRCDVLLSALARRAATAAPPDALVRAAIARLLVPRLAVARLARELGVSERQLRRRFDATVGYGPRRLARVLRLGRALAAAHAGEELGRVAADAGYADQAHFAHDCRSLAGASPSALLHG